MIAPHQGKLDLPPIRRRQKSLIQSSFPIGAVVKTVPVENKCIYPVISGRGNLLRHHLGTGFVLVPPQRNPGLNVTGKAGSGMLCDTPLSPAFSMQRFNARITVPVWEIVGGNKRPLFHDFSNLSTFNFLPQINLLPVPREADDCRVLTPFRCSACSDSRRSSSPPRRQAASGHSRRSCPPPRSRCAACRPAPAAHCR